MAKIVQCKSSLLKSISVNGKLVDFTTPKIMGVINITNDSFFSGSRVDQIDQIISRVHQMIIEGATFIDIGGYSSRPGAADISQEVELQRVIEPIQQIKRQIPEAIISIDTFRAGVAEKALQAGATIINDISAGHLDSKMFDLVASVQVPYVAMHMRGTPQTMRERNEYQDMLKEMLYYFSEIINELTNRSVNDILIDPGFGFAKDIDQNFYLLNHLNHFHWLQRPIVVGLSRKSMIYKTINLQPEDALNGTTVLNTVAILKGASILRVHDVAAAVEVIKLLEKLDHS